MRYILTFLILAIVCAYFYSPERFFNLLNIPIAESVATTPKRSASWAKDPIVSNAKPQLNDLEPKEQQAAQQDLANRHENTQKSPAFLKLKKHAEDGSVEAQFFLGELLSDGVFIKKDEEQAVFWFRKAAEQGLAKAQVALGSRYKWGSGVFQDYRQAIAWYKKAADKGDSSAQVELGAMYQGGLGVPTDDTIAAYWYREAAERGDVYGQYNLANTYSREGRGVKRDYIQAYAWANVAAASPNDFGGKTIRDVYILSYLSADNLVKAQELSRTYFQLYASPSSQIKPEQIERMKLYKLYILPSLPAPEQEKLLQTYDLIEKQIQNASSPVSQ